MPSWLLKSKKSSSSAVRLATTDASRQPPQPPPQPLPPLPSPSTPSQQPQQLPHPGGDIPSDTGAAGKAIDRSDIELALCSVLEALHSWQRLDPSIKQQQQHLHRQVSQPTHQEPTAAVRQQSQSSLHAHRQQDSRRQLLYQQTINSPECREAIRNLREYLEQAAAAAAAQEQGATAMRSTCTVASDCLEDSVSSASLRRELKRRRRRQLASRQRQRQLLCPKHGDPKQLQQQPLQPQQPVCYSNSPTEADLASVLTSEAVQESDCSVGACSYCRQTVEQCLLSSANSRQMPPVRYHLPAWEASVPGGSLERVKQLPGAHLSGWGRSDLRVLAYDCTRHCCQSGTVLLTGPERVFPPAGIVPNFLLPPVEVRNLNLATQAPSFGEALRRSCEDTDSSEDDDCEDTDGVGEDAEEDEEEEEEEEHGGVRDGGSQDFNGNAENDEEAASYDCVDSLETTTCESGGRLDATASGGDGNNSNTGTSLPVIMPMPPPPQPPLTPAPPPVAPSLPISAPSETTATDSALLHIAGEMPTAATVSVVASVMSDKPVAAVCEKPATISLTKPEAPPQLCDPSEFPSPTKVATSPPRSPEGPRLAATPEQGAEGGVVEEAAGVEVRRARPGGQQRQSSRSGRSATTLDVLDNVASVEGGEKSAAGDSVSSGAAGSGDFELLAGGSNCSFDIPVSPQPQPFFRLIETLGRAQRRMEGRHFPVPPPPPPPLPLPPRPHAMTPSPRLRSASPSIAGGDDQHQQRQQHQPLACPQISHRQRANVHSLNQILMQSPFMHRRSQSQQQQQQQQQQQKQQQQQQQQQLQQQYQQYQQQPHYLLDLQPQHLRQSRQTVRNCANCQAPQQSHFHRHPYHHPQQLRRNSVLTATLSDHVPSPSVATDAIKTTASSLLTLSQTMQLCVRQIEETVHRLNTTGLSQ